jgi:hypothetical protein
MDRNLYGTLAYPWFVGTYREISIKLTARGIGAPQTHQPVSLPQQLPIQARVAGLEVAVQLSPETTDDPGAADVLSVDARYHTPWEV